MDLPPFYKHLLEPAPPWHRQASEITTDFGKLGRLLDVYDHFGARAVEAIMLGSSRPIKTTEESVGRLIDDWEHREKSCCYDGSLEDLFKLKHTFVFAVSYRHVPQEQWYRKKSNYPNRKRECKMSDEDQTLLKKALTRFGETENQPDVILWCDQVLASRPQCAERVFEWYHIGLLPYMTFWVLTLSTHIPAHELEKRVWIRAERSLGRLSFGCFNADDMKQGRLSEAGAATAIISVMKVISTLMISGYWPEDLGHWKDDYKKMKKWALGVTCRGNSIWRLPIFQKHDDVDNIEILRAIKDLAAIPNGFQTEYVQRFTEDKQFFLKSYSWNPFLEPYWEINANYVSHYMGHMMTRFTWWEAEGAGLIFGCLELVSSAINILAKETESGYQIFKCEGQLRLYRHAQRTAGSEVQRAITVTAQRFGVDTRPVRLWKLLYSSDDASQRTKMTPDEVQKALEKSPQSPFAEAIVPQVFEGMTTKLYDCAVAKSLSNDRQAVANEVAALTQRWNEKVRCNHNSWISVRDASNGPVWLEGFGEHTMEFGFLEYLTEELILHKQCSHMNSITLPSSWEMIRELRKKGELLAERTRKEEEQGGLFPLLTSGTLRLGVGTAEIVEELYGSIREENCEERLSRNEVARFMLAGGFSTGFGNDSLLTFLETSAKEKGYWSTHVSCQMGKLQIRFDRTTSSGLEQMVAQRTTTLKDYEATGLVHPRDSDMVKTIALPCGSTKKTLRDFVWWKMEDTTTRAILSDLFPYSTRRSSNGESILMVDMTLGKGSEEGQFIPPGKFGAIQKFTGVTGPSSYEELVERNRKAALGWAASRRKDQEILQRSHLMSETEMQAAIELMETRLSEREKQLREELQSLGLKEPQSEQ